MVRVRPSAGVVAKGSHALAQDGKETGIKLCDAAFAEDAREP